MVETELNLNKRQGIELRVLDRELRKVARADSSLEVGSKFSKGLRLSWETEGARVYYCGPRTLGNRALRPTIIDTVCPQFFDSFSVVTNRVVVGPGVMTAYRGLAKVDSWSSELSRAFSDKVEELGNVNVYEEGAVRFTTVGQSQLIVERLPLDEGDYRDLIQTIRTGLANAQA